MRKDYLDRLNETIAQVTALKPQLFAGYNTGKIREILLKKIKIGFNYHELSDLLSLGGVRILRTNQDKTNARHVQRLTLLFHRVLCYHTAAETQALKRTIKGFDLQKSLMVAEQHVRRGIRYLTDRRSWTQEIPLRYGGRLVHYYSQGQDNRLKASDLTEHGWCLGMSVEWLGRKNTRQEFWGEHMDPSSASRYRFVMAAQKVRTSGLHGSNVSDRAAFRLKRFGLTASGVTKAGGDASPTSLARNIANSPAPFCRIGQSYKSGGGHAMAAYLNKGGVSFMDPNLGEMFFASPARFAEWFPLFARFMGYDYRSHYVEQYRSTQKGMAPGLADALRNRRQAMGY